ncbi:MAG: NAD-dependent epimerase/dehydratase family protein [Betaproteobacteria bacterium]|nr:MAG: NAD-dependent epimerase/dehydratase family protein [Betaproteobacteria bacterium]
MRIERRHSRLSRLHNMPWQIQPMRGFIMRLLILGGTLFLGRHIVETALERGHEVTLFNRGQRNADLFPELTRLRGDRNGDMSALLRRSFDAVIDCCGYTPEQMARTAQALDDKVPHYTFVSTVSVYERCPANVVFDEHAAIDPGSEGYGAQKARAEEAIERAYPQRVAHIRPGLIVGAHDPTGRFTYWPRRFAAAATGELNRTVLAPGDPSRPIQWIDVRDLARFCVHVAEHNIVGRFNAVTPAKAFSMGDLLNACNDATGAQANIHWMSDARLTAAEVAEWTELPLWIAQTNETHGGMLLADSSRAVQAGLRFSTLDDTVRATLAWCNEFPDADAATRVKTITPEREAQLLRQ